MDWVHSLSLIMVGYVALLSMRIPVLFAFLIVILVASLAVFPNWLGPLVVARNFMAGLTSFVLLPIPLFLLIGNLYVESGAGGRAVAAVNQRVLRRQGREGLVALCSGALLSMVSGSSLAAASLIIRTLAPMHQSDPERLRPTAGAALASGGIAIFVPPSALAVLVASVAQVNVSEMLIAIVPMAATMTCLYSLVIRMTEPRTSAPHRFRSSASIAIWPHFLRIGGLFSVMMITILLNWATPTEAAALGVACTAFMLGLTGELNVRTFVRAVARTAMDSASLLLIVAMAGVFSQVMVFLGIAGGVREFLSSIDDDPIVLLGASVAVALLLGCFLDGVSITMICVPLFLPALVDQGLPPMIFCLALLLCIETGLLTPPFGLLLVLASGLLKGRLKTTEIVRATFPYVLANVLILAALCLLAAILAG